MSILDLIPAGLMIGAVVVNVGVLLLGAYMAYLVIKALKKYIRN